MTPKKVLLQKIYFLTVYNDDTGFVNSDEFPLEVAFSVAGRVPSWKVDVIQDGNRFQMNLILLELAGNWMPLAKKLENVFWKSESEFVPEVMCDFSDSVVEICQPLDSVESSDDDEYENKVFVFLEEIDPSFEWYEIMEEDPNFIEQMKDAYLVLDKKGNLAILKVDNRDDLYNIDSAETLNFWTDYYEDDLIYNFSNYKLGQLLAMNAFDEVVVIKLLKEIISKHIEFI